MSELKSVSLKEVQQVTVESGTANIFLVAASGERWPFATVDGPMLVTGPSAGDHDLLVVANINAVLTAEDGQIQDEAIGQWRELLAQLHDEKAESVRALDRRGLADFLEQALIDTVAELQAADAAAVESARQVDAMITANAVARIEADIADPTRASRSSNELPSFSREVTAMRVSGQWLGVDVPEPPHLAGVDRDPLRAVARACGVSTRAIQLREGWTKEAAGALIGSIESDDGGLEPVALLPARKGYVYQSYEMPLPLPYVEADGPELMNVVEVYQPLPRDREATLSDLAKIALRGTGRTCTAIVACSLGVALLGLVTPALTSTVLDVLLPENKTSGMVVVGIFLTMLALSAGAFVAVQNFATSRLTQLAQMRVEAAVWARTLTLPLSFFRQYSSGDLAYRVTAVDQLKQLLSSQTVTSILAAIFSLVNFFLLFTYSVPLAMAAFLVVAVTAVFMYRLSRQMAALIRGANESQRDATAWFVQLATGISKIRVAGCEKRFTALSLLKQAEQINNQAAQTMLSGRLAAYLAAIGALAPLLYFVIVGTVLWGSSGPEITTTTYIAFSTAFGTVMGAITGLSSAVPAIAAAGPTLDLVRPILNETQQEIPDAHPISGIRGQIEFRSVSFRYLPTMPTVLSDLSFEIEAGKTTAIVGPSGSGKSTAMTLMTGLEYPEEGSILFDGEDIRSVDGVDLRRNLGVVIQGAQLMNGSILDNIGGGAIIAEEEAWKAAEMADIAEDIKAMPMKMHTIVSSTTLSGGQTQRVMIARAFARRASVLLLDEATSALDNVSQSVVMDSVSSYGGTAVIVAQRLSTIKSADTILVVDNGSLVEQGTYEDLLAAGGLFATLAKRQLSAKS